jgi:hypothetical protein
VEHPPAKIAHGGAAWLLECLQLERSLVFKCRLALAYSCRIEPERGVAKWLLFKHC